MANFDPALLGYLALFILLAASFAVRIEYVRAGLALAALVALPLALVAGQALVAGLLLLAIILANIAFGWRDWLRNLSIRFSSEEEQLRARHFDRLSATAARGLIDQGHWISARQGEVLIRENQAAPSLFYLSQGVASVLRDGVEVGAVSDGALIGEATVLDGAQATGTVTLSTNARLWFIPAAVLRDYLAANPDIAAALHEGFARALRGKLASANARIAEAPSL